MKQIFWALLDAILGFMAIWVQGHVTLLSNNISNKYHLKQYYFWKSCFWKFWKRRAPKHPEDRSQTFLRILKIGSTSSRELEMAIWWHGINLFETLVLWSCGPLEPKTNKPRYNYYVCKSWNLQTCDCGQLRVSRLSICVFGFLELWSFASLSFWNFGTLKLWNCGTLDST